MARTIRKSGMKEVPLSEVKDDLSRYLREAETQEIVITRHGKPARVLIGFESEEDWFEYRLEHDPRFLRRIEQARHSLRAGRGSRRPAGPATRPQVSSAATSNSRFCAAPLAILRETLYLPGGRSISWLSG